MKAIDIFRAANAEHSAKLARPRKDCPGEYDARDYCESGNKRGWMLIDATTANAVTRVHEALSPANQAKFENLSLLRMVDIAWKLVS